MSSPFASSISSKLTPFRLPGFSLPLNFTPHKEYSYVKRINGEFQSITVPSQGEGVDLFRTALNEQDLSQGYATLPLITLRELTMLHLMNYLTDKPEWDSKV